MVFYIKNFSNFFFTSLPLSLKIALYFQMGWKKEKITSFISYMLIVGVTLNIVVGILSISIINGFEDELKNKILNIVPHIEVNFLKQLSVKNWKTLKKNIEKIPDVKVTSPYLNFSGLIENKTEFYILNIHAVDSQYEIKFQKNVKIFFKNQLNILLQLDAINNAIIIGEGLAQKLNLKIGDILPVFPMQTNNKNNFIFPQIFKFKVIGIIKFNSQLDYHFAVISLSTAQVLLNRINEVDGINIKVKNMFKLNDVIRSLILIEHSNFFEINTWILKYGYMYQDIQTIRTIIYLCAILISFIFASSIISILIAIMKKKIYDINILFSLGAKNKLIYCIFLWYSLIYIIFGIIFGTSIGLLASYYFDSIIQNFEEFLNIKIFPSNAYFINFIPIKIIYSDVLCIISLIFLLVITCSSYSIFKIIHKNSIKSILS
ncbi:MAG: FtsX-like permease family protein [Wigglesworthia glossinidia]|nr:FtsX-like permease family protein [Wigglesworthia glossinidia]